MVLVRKYELNYQDPARAVEEGGRVFEADPKGEGLVRFLHQVCVEINGVMVLMANKY